MVAVRRRERLQRFCNKDDRSTSSVDEFKVLAGRERKYDFREFAVEDNKSTTSTEPQNRHDVSSALSGTFASEFGVEDNKSKTKNGQHNVPNASSAVSDTKNNESSSQNHATRNMPMEGSFYFEDRSEPIEETLPYAGRGGRENDEKADLAETLDTPNMVQDHMDSESDYESYAVYFGDQHSDDAHEREYSTCACNTITQTTSAPTAAGGGCVKKSILRPGARAPLTNGDDKSNHLRCSKSSVRSRSSSFRSSDAGSVSATSQKSYLKPIARIRVMESATESDSTTNGSGASLHVKGEDESHFPSLSSGKYGDEITDAGTALISTNRGYTRRPSLEELSEASSIIVSGDYSSFSSKEVSDTQSEGSNPINALSKEHHDDRDQDKSNVQHSRKAMSPYEFMASFEGSKKRTPHSARRLKMSQRLKQGFRKSVKTLKYIFTGKLLSKGFKGFKKAGRTLLAAIKKPFAPNLKSKVLPEPVATSTLTGKNNLIDEELAQSLINARTEDESTVVRASRYVATGRELLSDAAKLKEEDPIGCTVLTKEARTYAYAARQMAKHALISRKTRGKIGENAEHNVTKQVSREIAEDDHLTVDEDARNDWKKKLEEIQLFSFEDIFRSPFLCLNVCGDCGSDKSTLEVDEALQILAKLSEEEVHPSNSMVSSPTIIGTCQDVKAQAPNTVINRSFLSVGDSATLETQLINANTMERSSTATIKELVTALQKFYEADQTLSVTHQERPSISKETTIPGVESIGMRTLKNSDTFDIMRLKESLFSADDEDDKDEQGVRDKVDPTEDTEKVFYEGLVEEKQQHQSDNSCDYSVSLKNDGESSNSHSSEMERVSFTTEVINPSTSCRSMFASISRHARTTTDPTGHLVASERGQRTVVSTALKESSSHSRSIVHKWGLRRKGNC